MKKWMVVGALIFAVGLAIFFFRDDSVRSVKLKFSATSMEFGMERGQVEFASVLRWLFEQGEKTVGDAARAKDTFVRRLRNWLLGEAGAVGEAATAEKERRKEAQLLLVEALSAASPDHPISQRLRNLEHNGIGPFERKERTVSVSFLASLDDKTAAVCMDSVFSNKHIALLKRGGSEAVRLHVGAVIVPCEQSRPGISKDNWIQVSHDVGKRLFRAKLLGFEDAIVIINPPAELIAAAGVPGEARR